MSRVQALFENEEITSILTENEEILTEAQEEVNGWVEEMNDFIAENIEEFIGSTLEETYKNVYTFATFATSQYLSEMSHVYGNLLEESASAKIALQEASNPMKEFI